MGEFFSSKFIKDLESGKLPVVEVAVTTEGLIQISAVLFFTAVAILLSAKIIKSF